MGFGLSSEVKVKYDFAHRPYRISIFLNLRVIYTILQRYVVFGVRYKNMYHYISTRTGSNVHQPFK